MMKEAPKFESVFQSLLAKPDLLRKVLLGCLFSFIPIVNLLSFGYLMQVCRESRRHGVVVLPEWTDWKSLFLDGFYFAAAWLIYWLLPVWIVNSVCGQFNGLLFGILAYLLPVIAMIFCSLLLCSALYRLLQRSHLRALLEVSLIYRMVRGLLPSAFVAILASVGLAAISWPLYGITFFISPLLLIAYASLYFRWIEEAAVGRA
ncbi:MAG: DUF4013 domain-containing protein [Coraliomargaritaceae bacterium]